jgi:pimeloyl-ACP methyl ester carboxylesterase
MALKLGGLRFLGGSPIPRTPVRTRVRLTLRMGYEYKQAEVCEISRDGLFLRAGDPWPVGSPVDIALHVLDENVPLVGTGEVERVDTFALRVAGVVPGMFIRFVEFGRKADGLPDWIGRARYVQGMASALLVDNVRYFLHELRGDRFEKDFGQPGSGFRTPILLIHGYLGTRGVMLPLENRLKRLGFPIFSVHLGALNASDIRRSAKRIAEVVGHVAERYQLPKIDVIGHSMGGLIGLYFVKHLGGDAQVRKLISIGTPYDGTYAAVLGVALFGALTRSVWQLLKGSAFIRELHAGELPEGTRYYSIMAKNDELCRPGDCALAGARNYLVAGGHSTLLNGDEPFRHIKDILEDRDPLPMSGVVPPLRRTA